jgi:[ribosomal protein S5]-alanine N-acetyltransferase
VTPVTLYTERLRLYTPEVEDASEIATYMTANWQHLEPWMPTPPNGFFTPEHWERFATAHQSDETQLTLLIRPQEEEDTLLGVVRFTSIARGPAQLCNLGYNLAQSAQGHGYLTEALPTALDYVFSTLGLHRVQANYIPRNERSGRLLRRLGFVVEGYARDYLKINGCWEDHILTSKTAPMEAS